LAIGLTYPLLQRLGFNPAEGAVNTPQAIMRLQEAFLGGPIIFVILGGLCLIGWRLDAKRHGVIREQLDARDAEAQAAWVVAPGVASAPTAEQLPSAL
jgi:Na+/melibiose symporter-like transporter